ncbi:MAG: glutamate racemase [Planctomycetota bacterium]|jgi:glutamate racemase
MSRHDRHPGARPIGVFDSGLGGLTAVRRIFQRMPGEDVVYLGDSARVPYGTKSPQTVCEFARQDAAFLGRFDPKLIVVACNTASAVAMDALRESVPAEVIGVVAPAAAEAVRLAAGGLIGVIGTEGTIASGAHRKAVQRLAGGKVMSAAAPLLVPIVEEGRPQDDPIVLSVLGDYLRDMQRARPAVLILGCTHYPLLARAIAKLMGPGTALLDPGEATAGQVQRRLADKGWVNPQRQGTLRCFSTDTPDRFARLARRFLGQDVGEVSWVGTDELAGTGQGVTA